MRNKKKILALIVVAVLVICSLTVTALAADGETEEPISNMYGTIWSLLPPIIAIALALITKEVYTSLFTGVIVGALFVNNFSVIDTLEYIVSFMINDLGDAWYVGILMFLIILGIIVVMMNQSGASAAYGRWAKKTIKSRRGAMLATVIIGIIISIDDYFNCLTVGNVMRPVTDLHKVSRAKLAYIIDATAAPICMIMPVSSWAAAVSGYVQGYDGLALFVKAIPYNFYSLLTILMMVLISIFDIDFGWMKKHEENAKNGDLYTTPERPFEGADEMEANERGRTCDLFIPIIVLVVCCVVGLIYSGGFFDGGMSFVDAFGNADASFGLSFGSFIALIIIFVYYLIRRVINLKKFAESIPSGFKAMVPAILILICAWTLSDIVKTDLGAQEFVGNLMEGGAQALFNFLPAVIFLVAVGLAFATGTSWGTMGILLPIVIPVFDTQSPLFIIGISAVLAGAVCGDHCSPISDTTIMASTGAHCYHINHVQTQLPYSLTVAAVSFVSYIIAGWVQNVFICLPIAIILMVGVLVGIKAIQNNTEAKMQKAK